MTTITLDLSKFPQGALQAARLLCADSEENGEYVRGVAELLIDMTPDTSMDDKEDLIAWLGAPTVRPLLEIVTRKRAGLDPTPEEIAVVTAAFAERSTLKIDSDLQAELKRLFVREFVAYRDERSRRASNVEIPCSFQAEYVDGEITKWTVSPLASYAGYGPEKPSAVLMDGDADLEVHDLDGPFWSAVREALNEGCFHPARIGAGGPIINVVWEE